MQLMYRFSLDCARVLGDLAQCLLYLHLQILQVILLTLLKAAVPLVKTLRHHSNSVLCLAADGEYIISASKDNTVVVHDRRADKSLYKVRVSVYGHNKKKKKS